MVINSGELRGVTIVRALWHNAFKDIPYQEVFNAFNYWLSIEKVMSPMMLDLSRKIKQELMTKHNNIEEVLIHLNPYYPKEYKIVESN